MASFFHGKLARFRPVAAPGAPAGAAPADQEGARRSELEPVFASLADTESEAAAIGEEAARTAARIRAEAAARAEAIVREAMDRRASERERAAAQVLRDADLYRQEVLERSHARAAAIEERAAPLLDAFVDEAVGEARDRLLRASAGDRR